MYKYEYFLLPWYIYYNCIVFIDDIDIYIYMHFLAKESFCVHWLH